MYYCPRCDNLLSEITSGDKLEFRCPTCAENYAATPEATLLMSDNIGEDQASKFRKFIKNSAHDPINIKVLDECNKCHCKIATHIRVTDQQKVLHTCKCGNIWEPTYDTGVSGQKSKPKPKIKKGADEKRPGVFERLHKYKSSIKNVVDIFITKRTGHLDPKHRAHFKKIFWDLVDENVEDIVGIKKLHTFYKDINNQEDFNSTAGRAESRIKNIATWLEPYKGKKYLDIGCSEAGITEAVADYLNIIDKPGYAYATDIALSKNLPKDNEIIFSTNTPDNLDYPDKKFDLITAFMALHHFTHVPQMINEMYRVLKPKGILIIREHDSNDPAFAAFLDFVHLMYATILHNEDDPKCFLTQNETFYNTREVWTDELKKYGFKFMGYIDSKNPRTNGMDLFRSYYGKYQRV